MVVESDELWRTCGSHARLGHTRVSQLFQPEITIAFFEIDTKSSLLLSFDRFNPTAPEVALSLIERWVSEIVSSNFSRLQVRLELVVSGIPEGVLKKPRKNLGKA